MASFHHQDSPPTRIRVRIRIGIRVMIRIGVWVMIRIGVRIRVRVRVRVRHQALLIGVKPILVSRLTPAEARSACSARSAPVPRSTCVARPPSFLVLDAPMSFDTATDATSPSKSEKKGVTKKKK